MRASLRSLCWVLPMLTLVADASAQVLTNEHRQFAWLESRRRDVLQLLAGAKPKIRGKAAQQLVEQRRLGSPLLTLAHAHAVAKGREADRGFVVRHGLTLFALPEVVDPKRFPTVAITAWAPRNVPMRGKASFSLRIYNSGGRVVRRLQLGQDKTLGDLRSFRVTQAVAVDELPDGSYLAEVEVKLGNESQRDGDPRLQTHFHVCRGLVERHQKLTESAAKLSDVPPHHAGILAAALRQVDRMWKGRPGVGPQRAMADVRWAERVVSRLAAKENPLQGVRGWVLADLGAEPRVRLALRMQPVSKSASRPASGPSSRKTTPAPPLVLIMAGGPSWDCAENRPAEPRSVAPAWTVAQLERVGFDAKHRYQVVVCESPGRLQSTQAALQHVLRELPKLVRFDPERILLVGERQGANGMAFLAMQDPSSFRGLVLVSGGVSAMTRNNLESMALPLLVVPGHGHPGGSALHEQWAHAKRTREGKHVEFIDEMLPWSIALPLASRWIESFAARVLAGE